MMHLRLRTLTCVLACAVAVCAGHALAAADDANRKEDPSQTKFVTLLHPGPFYFRKELTDGKVTLVAHVPIELKSGLQPSDVSAVVRYAAFGNQEMGQLANACGAEVVLVKNAYHLRLTASLDGIIQEKRFGTYELLVWVMLKEGHVPQDPPLPVLRVDYPATTLELPQQLTFKRQLNLVDENTFKPSSFNVRVKDGPQADSVRVSAEPVDGATVNFGNITKFELLKENTVNVTPQDFPLGETAFEISIRSPDFATVKVPAKMQVKRTPYLIVVIAVVGIFVGAFLRNGADWWISLFKLKIQLNTVLTNVLKQRGRSKDKSYKQSLDGIETDAKAEIAALTIYATEATITAAKAKIKESEEALEKAVNDFLERENNLQNESAELSNLTGVAFDLPEALRTSLRAQHDQLKTVNSKIAKGQLDEATSDLKKLKKSVDDSILTLLKEWGDDVQISLQMWKAIRPILPQALKAPFDAGLVSFRAKLAEISHTGEKADGGHWLEIGDAAYRLADGLVERTIVELCISGTIVLQDLEQSPHIDSTQLQSLRVAINQLEPLAYQGHLSNPRGQLKQLTPHLEFLTKALQTAIADRVDDVKDDATSARGKLKTQIATSLDSGDYEQAALSLVTLLRTPAPQKIAHALEVAQQRKQQAQQPAEAPPGSVTRQTSIATGDVRELRLPPAPIFPLTRIRIARIEDDIADSVKQMALIQWIRWLIVLCLLAASAFFLYQKTFVGTPGDIFMVFLWGFTLDVGVNSFVEKSGSVIAAIQKT